MPLPFVSRTFRRWTFGVRPFEAEPFEAGPFEAGLFVAVYSLPKQARPQRLKLDDWR